VIRRELVINWAEVLEMSILTCDRTAAGDELWAEIPPCLILKDEADLTRRHLLKVKEEE